MEGGRITVISVKKNRPYIIGLTGGVASGKSSALNIFKECGIDTIDCDEIVSNLWNEEFFKELIRKNFNLDIKDSKKLKSVVSSIVFENDNERKKLNNLTHPLVLSEIDKIVDSFKNKEMVVIDMPLLFEIDYQKVDTTLLIYVNEKEQLKRLCQRSNLNGIQASKIIESQIPLSRKYFLADYVIDNNGSIYQLGKEIKEFIKNIQDEIKGQN